MILSSPPNNLIPRSEVFAHERLAQLAARFGTPLFVYDAAILSNMLAELMHALPLGMQILYSVKANPAIGIIEQFASLGTGFEVASIGELNAVARAGGNVERAIFVGPGKRTDEIRSALELGLGKLVVESPGEVERVARIAKDLGARMPVLLRINPGLPKLVASSKGPSLTMAGRTQFGMTVEEALVVLTAKPRLEGCLDIHGLHAYLGTRILDSHTIASNTRLILETAATLQQLADCRLRCIDVGGGFGVPYYSGEQHIDGATLRRELEQIIARYVESHPWTEAILFESGRFLTAASGVFISSVIEVKPRDTCTFVILDGGAAAIGGRDGYAGARVMPVEIIGQRGPESPMNLCGPLCTPMDRVAANVLLPTPSPGSLAVFYLAGAYSLTASAGMFLSHGYCAEVLVEGQKEVLIRPRQDPIDIVHGQCLFSGVRTLCSLRA